jgi:flagellin
MSVTTGARINTNIGALNSLNALNSINQKLGTHQLRLATGKRINMAADDPSGYVITKKMDATIRSLDQALANVGDAQSVYGVAEGGMKTISDILVQIKERQVRFNNSAMGEDEKAAIRAEVVQLAEEIDDIVAQTKFNNERLLFDGTGSAYSGSFQVSDSSADTIAVNLDVNMSIGGLFSGIASGAAITVDNLSSLDVSAALKTVNDEVGRIGAVVNRLQVKEENIMTAITNTQASKSRILDADIAREQIESVKAQILQQTATAQLAQANMSPQVFLSLF